MNWGFIFFMHVNVDINLCHIAYMRVITLVTLRWQLTLPKNSNTFRIMPLIIINPNTTQKDICKDNPTTKRVVYFMQNMDNAQLVACFTFISTSQYVPLCLHNIK